MVGIGIGWDMGITEEGPTPPAEVPSLFGGKWGRQPPSSSRSLNLPAPPNERVHPVKQERSL